MGAPKAQLRVGGARLLDRAVAALVDGGCDDVVAVVRPGTAVVGAQAVENLDRATGMRSSLDVALDHLSATGAHTDHLGLAVLLVDTPGIGAATVAAVLNHWRQVPDRIAVAQLSGRRAHPTVMSLSRWRAALDIAGADEGARKYLSAFACLIDEVAAPGDPTDLDWPADLVAWNRRNGGDEEL